MSNAEGRWDGVEKAQVHSELCEKTIKALIGPAYSERWRNFHCAVHTRTQDLTGYLNERIGFPLRGRPDYDVLAPLFFEDFYDLAKRAICEEIDLDLRSMF